MTCHNRRNKTLACLDALMKQASIDGIMMQVYLVDDGCTDDTGEAVHKQYPQVNVLQGDGNLYWCGGMRMAFVEAMKGDYDYYLWLNDDTLLYPQAVQILLETSRKVQKVDGGACIVIGAICDPDSGKQTYGGVLQVSNRCLLKFKRLDVNDKPQRCDTMNGNCVLIPRDVAAVVGNLSKKFTHGVGDYDYGLRARAKGISSWTTPGYVGTCSRNMTGELLRDANLPIEERLRIMASPTGLPPIREWLCFTKRHAGVLWPLYWARTFARACSPRLWLWFRARRSKQHTPRYSMPDHASVPVETPRVRTLIFHPALAPYRVDLFNELAKHLDLKVVFLGENLRTQKFNQHRLRNLLKCEHKYLNSGANILGRQVRWGIARAISEYKPDVVVGTEYSPTTLHIALLKSLFPGQHWGFMTLTSDNVQICTKSTLARRIARRFVMYAADGMIVYSNPVKSWYVKYGVPEKSIGVCSNIQSEDRFRSLLVRARSLAIRFLHDRKLLGKRIILFVGRLVQIKGVDRIIAAFADASRSNPDSRLVIVGDGPEQKKLVELAKSIGVAEQVIFTGRLEGLDLMAWYLIGQTLVLASDHEPYGAVVIEALLAGIPVLCSSVAGATDLILEGQNGYIFDPYDIASLTLLLSRQLGRIVPLEEEMVDVKESLMPISFKDSVKDFIRAVEYAAGSKIKQPGENKLI